MNGKIEATPVKPWFPLIVADWLDSDDVQRMTTSERGVYITLLIHQWVLGRLPAKLPVLEKVSGIERRILGRFLGKYPKTFVQVSGNPEKIANRKLHKLQTGRDLTFFHSPEESRQEENEKEERKPNEDGSKIEDVRTLPASRNQKARAAAAKPDCKKCGGSGREIYRDPNPRDPLGYNETSRECECVQLTGSAQERADQSREQERPHRCSQAGRPFVPGQAPSSLSRRNRKPGAEGTGPQLPGTDPRYHAGDEPLKGPI